MLVLVGGWRRGRDCARAERMPGLIVSLAKCCQPSLPSACNLNPMAPLEPITRAFSSFVQTGEAPQQKSEEAVKVQRAAEGISAAVAKESSGVEEKKAGGGGEA